MVLIIKKTAFFLLFALLLCMSSASAASDGDAPEVSAQCAALSCGGRLIYSKNASVRMPMASTTKLMTAIIVLENCALDEVVEVKADQCGIEGSSMYLRPGRDKTVEELLTGLLLVSGNDAAAALACHVSGTEAAFTALMNQKAAQLGMVNTSFANPHGLPDPAHFSTAADLAKLMEYCMENPDFARIDSMKSRVVDGNVLVNHNRLLSDCPGCIGGKTGYTMTAGRCLVSCCEREGGRLVCVTLAAPDDWNDHSGLYDWGFDLCEMRSATDSVRFSVPLSGGTCSEAKVLPAGPVDIFVPACAEISCRVELPQFVFAPVNAGERAGKVRIFVDGEPAGEYYLIYSDNVPMRDDI